MPAGSWDFLCTFPTQQTKRTECCVLGTPFTLKPQYLILSTSPVLTTGNTSYITKTELILPIQLMGIHRTHSMNYVNWRCLVRHCPLIAKFNFHFNQTWHKQPWVIQKCLNEGSHPFSRGDNSEITKIH